MEIKSTLFAYTMLGVFVTSILFVLFGQLTVRKLRNNPATKNSLGVSLASGWDILKVAKSLSVPQWYRERVKKSSLSAFEADYELLYENTTKFDRALAKVFWWLWMSTGGFLILLALLDSFGMFD